MNDTNNYVNKAIGIGVVIAVIIGIIITSAGISMNLDKDTDAISEEIVLEGQEEIVLEEVQEGQNFSVELTESVGIKGP